MNGGLQGMVTQPNGPARAFAVLGESEKDGHAMLQGFPQSCILALWQHREPIRCGREVGMPSRASFASEALDRPGHAQW